MSLSATLQHTETSGSLTSDARILWSTAWECQVWPCRKTFGVGDRQHEQNTRVRAGKIPEDLPRKSAHAHQDFPSLDEREDNDVIR
jgi:hypothetical protein